MIRRREANLVSNDDGCDLVAVPRSFALIARPRAFALEAEPRRFDLEAEARCLPKIIVVPPWSPTDILGLVFWVDAADATTLFQIDSCTVPAVLDGDVVGCWQDKSGNNYHMVQSTTARKPMLRKAVLGGEDVVRFDGTDDRLSSIMWGNHIINQIEMFIVTICNDDASSQTFIATRQSGYAQGTGDYFFQMQYRTGAAGDPLRATGYDGVYRTSTHANSSLGTRLCGLRGLAQNYIYSRMDLVDGPMSGVVNNWTNPAGGSPALGSNLSGGSEFADGDIAEAVVYNSVLSSANRTDVETYLSNKWGLGLF